MNRLLSRRVAAAGVILCLAAVTVGCGARVVPDELAAVSGAGAGDAISASGAQGAAVDGAPTGTEATGAGTDVAAMGESGEPVPTPSRTSFMNNGEVVLTPVRTCAEIGQLMEIRVQAPRNAALVLVVQFSDDEAHGTLQSGLADAQGRYDWRFPIPLDAPPGKAMAIAVSSGRDFDEGMGGTEGGGGGSAEFMVAELGDC